MAKSISSTRIYRSIIDILEKSPLHRGALIEECIKRLGKAEDTEATHSGDPKNNLRSRAGVIINEMHSRGLIGIDNSGKYFLRSERPVIIRIDRCEREIIKALSEAPHTKFDLKNRLKEVFGTDKTVSTRDDDTLSTYIGQILKRMLAENMITLNEGSYSLSPKISAHANDLNEILTLKTDFLKRVHSKGGEFFESYFMALLKKYYEKHGKKVLECYVTGGSADGGIDGVIKTEDSLGFIELTMVQTKNRVEISDETDVRGFYGAVCAKRGTRGIFVTTSDFHSGATDFLNCLDDCIGINGDRIFKMAIECSYGIKHTGKRYEIDTKLI